MTVKSATDFEGMLEHCATAGDGRIVREQDVLAGDPRRPDRAALSAPARRW